MYPGMEPCVGCGLMSPLLALLAVYEEPAVLVSVVGVRILLPLSICAGTAVLGCISSVWLTVDTLSARVVEPAGPWPKEMRSRVAWMVASAGSLPVTKHCCNWDALMRANETIVTGN